MAVADPVRKPEFLYRDHPTENGDLPVRCRECGFTWEIPLDWADDHVGETVPCPACVLQARIPTAMEAEWPDRKDSRDPVADVPMTERQDEPPLAEPPAKSVPDPDAPVE